MLVGGIGGDGLAQSRALPRAVLAPDPITGRLVDALVGGGILVAEWSQEQGARFRQSLSSAAINSAEGGARAIVEESRDLHRFAAEVEHQRVRWEQQGRPDDLLLADGRALTEGTRLVEEFGSDLPSGTRAYVAASTDAVSGRSRRRKRAAVVSALILATSIVVNIALLIILWRR